jgi:hypothetical protein
MGRCCEFVVACVMTGAGVVVRIYFWVVSLERGLIDRRGVGVMVLFGVWLVYETNDAIN